MSFPTVFDRVSKIKPWDLGEASVEPAGEGANDRSAKAIK
jgi:hypothetical protein